MDHVDQTVNPDWHQIRRRGIFATDVGPILRLSRFNKGPLDVAVEKICGVVLGRTTGAKSMGKRVEPIIGELWQEEQGQPLVQATTAIHPDNPWMGANADFVTPSGYEPLIVEAKANRDRYGWGEPGTDRVPADIAVQVQWQMACYQIERAEVAALFGLSEFAIYPIPRNEKLIGMLIEICHDFWQGCQRKEFPEYSWADPRTHDLVQHIYRPDGKTVIQLDDECQQLADEIERLGETETTIAKLRKEKRARLHEKMGTAWVGLLPDGVREVRRTLADVKEHKVAARTDNRLSVCKRAKNREVTNVV